MKRIAMCSTCYDKYDEIGLADNIECTTMTGSVSCGICSVCKRKRNVKLYKKVTTDNKVR